MDLRWARKWVAGEHEPQPLRAAPRRRHDHEELDCAAAAEEQEGSKQRKHAGQRLDHRRGRAANAPRLDRGLYTRTYGTVGTVGTVLVPAC